MYELIIVTLEKIVYQGQVKSIVVPGSEGLFEVLMNHAPIIASMKVGELSILETNNHRLTFTVTGGMFEFSRNKATVLADALTEKAPES
jgi:F-type H+-transporting ATPase subunit epsilon